MKSQNPWLLRLILENLYVYETDITRGGPYNGY